MIIPGYPSFTNLPSHEFFRNPSPQLNPFSLPFSGSTVVILGAPPSSVIEIQLSCPALVNPSLPKISSQCVEIGHMQPNTLLRKIRPGPPEAKSEKADQKSSVYDVASQLKSIPAQISIWERLSTLEAHRKSALYKSASKGTRA